MREAEIDCLDMGGGRSVRIREYKEINKSEVLSALKKMKCRKPPGSDGIMS